MKLSIDWLDDGVSSSAELRETASAIRILVDGTNVSSFVDRLANLAYSAPSVPAYVIADAFARHWWRITAGRANTFSLRHARAGYAVPDLVLTTDGVFTHCEARPYSYRNPPVTFFEGASEHISTSVIETAMRDMIDSVIEKLQRSNISDTALSLRWQAINRSLADDAEREFCEGAAALGVEPYTCTDDEAYAVEVAAKRLEGDSFGEFLASQTADSVNDSLQWLERNARTSDSSSVLDVPKFTDEGSSTSPKMGWELGYSAAKKFRHQLGIDSSKTFKSIHSIARLFGNGKFQQGEGRARNIRAAVYHNGATKFVLPDLIPTSKTFALTRAVGDHVMFGSEPIVPITDSDSYRQAAGRAFAAQFLAPAEAVGSARSAGLRMDEIAVRFGVSPEVIRWQLENASRIAASN
jgi:hypothetical protein